MTWSTAATLSVGGPGIYAYKYRVNDGPWSAEVPRPEAGLAADPEPLPPIVLTGLQNGQSYTVYVLGKDSAGVWQSESRPTASRTWTVDAAVPAARHQRGPGQQPVRGQTRQCFPGRRGVVL